jgi:hypothetical protein
LKEVHVMAEKNLTTEKLEERAKLIPKLTAIRAIGDLLCQAADTIRQGRSEFHEDTLASIGYHLEDMATEALVILRYEKPRPKPEGGGE